MKINSASDTTANLDTQPIARKVRASEEGTTRDIASVKIRSEAEVYPPTSRDHGAVMSRTDAEVYPPMARDVTVRPDAQVLPLRDALLAAVK